MQELQALISTDAHGDAVINLGHDDSVTLAGVAETQLRHVIQAGHVLIRDVFSPLFVGGVGEVGRRETAPGEEGCKQTM